MDNDSMSSVLEPDDASPEPCMPDTSENFNVTHISMRSPTLKSFTGDRQVHL